MLTNTSTPDARNSGLKFLSRPHIPSRVSVKALAPVKVARQSSKCAEGKTILSTVARSRIEGTRQTPAAAIDQRRDNPVGRSRAGNPLHKLLTMKHYVIGIHDN